MSRRARLVRRSVARRAKVRDLARLQVLVRGGRPDLLSVMLRRAARAVK